MDDLPAELFANILSNLEIHDCPIQYLHSACRSPQFSLKENRSRQNTLAALCRVNSTFYERTIAHLYRSLYLGRDCVPTRPLLRTLAQNARLRELVRVMHIFEWETGACLDPPPQMPGSSQAAQDTSISTPEDDLGAISLPLSSALRTRLRAGRQPHAEFAIWREWNKSRPVRHRNPRKRKRPGESPPFQAPEPETEASEPNAEPSEVKTEDADIATILALCPNIEVLDVARLKAGFIMRVLGEASDSICQPQQLQHFQSQPPLSKTKELWIGCGGSCFYYIGTVCFLLRLRSLETFRGSFQHWGCRLPGEIPPTPSLQQAFFREFTMSAECLAVFLKAAPNLRVLAFETEVCITEGYQALGDALRLHGQRLTSLTLNIKEELRTGFSSETWLGDLTALESLLKLTVRDGVLFGEQTIGSTAKGDTMPIDSDPQLSSTLPISLESLCVLKSCADNPSVDNQIARLEADERFCSLQITVEYQPRQRQE